MGSHPFESKVISLMCKKQDLSKNDHMYKIRFLVDNSTGLPPGLKEPTAARVRSGKWRTIR